MAGRNGELTGRLPVEDNESIQDQLDELRTRLIELNEFAQHIPLIGEAFGLIKGMLIDVIDASDADPDDFIDDLDRLDQNSLVT
jgi:hypothetical protein